MNSMPLLRRALRRIRRERGSSLAIVLLLALGVAASTALFSLAYNVLLRPLPGAQGHSELVTLAPRPFSIPGTSGSAFRSPLSATVFDEYRRRLSTLEGLVTWENSPVHLSIGGRGLRLEAQLVSEGFFPTLGVSAAQGTLDLGEGNDRSVVLSAHLRERLFPNGETVLGEGIRLNGEPFTVVGVADREFRGPWLNESVDLWLPHAAGRSIEPGAEPTSGPPGALWMVGRLTPGHTPAALRDQIEALSGEIGARLGEDLPGLEVTAGVGRRPGLLDRARRALALTSALALLVLAIACLNVGNLLLARALRRRSEIGVQMALGASRRSVAASFALEALLLTLPAAGLGWLLTAALGQALPVTDLVRHLPSAQLEVAAPSVVAFALGSAILVSIVTALPPTLKALRGEPAEALSQHRGTARHGRAGASHLVLALQVAVTLILMVGTVLLAQAGSELRSTDLGFTADGLAYVRVDLGRERYDEARGREFWERLLAELLADPGVEEASIALTLPLTPQGDAGRVAQLSPPPSIASEDPMWVQFGVVSPGYFPMLGIRRIEGRDFVPRDREGQEKAAIVNRALTQSLSLGDEAVGTRLTISGEPHRIVGVVDNIHWRDIEESPQPRFYLPTSQRYEETGFAVLRHRAGPEAGLVALRHHARRLDSSLPTFQAGSLAEDVDSATAQPRLLGLAFLSASLLAAILACLGIVALVDRTVAARLPEIGIRMALGGDRGEVRRRLLKPVISAALIGLATGLVGGFFVYRLLQSHLYGVAAANPVALGVGILALLGLLLAGAGWPAWRLTRVRDVAGLLRQN